MAQRVINEVDLAQFGSPSPDGYANQVLGVNVVTQNVNLGRSSVYKLQPYMSKNASGEIEDGYFLVLDAWNEVDFVGDSNEDAVTDSTGEILRHEQDRILITTQRRHVLSVKMPDGSTGTMSLRIIKLEPGFDLKDILRVPDKNTRS